MLIEFPHRHRSKGRPVHIRVELSVPGEDIVVNQETTPHFTFGDARFETAQTTLAGQPDHRDVVIAIRDAFDVARRRLEDFARRQRADVKTSRADAALVP